MLLIKRGDVWWVDFDPSRGGEIQKTRPAVVISNNSSNELLRPKWSERVISAMKDTKTLLQKVLEYDRNRIPKYPMSLIIVSKSYNAYDSEKSLMKNRQILI